MKNNIKDIYIYSYLDKKKFEIIISNNQNIFINQIFVFLYKSNLSFENYFFYFFIKNTYTFIKHTSKLDSYLIIKKIIEQEIFLKLIPPNIKIINKISIEHLYLDDLYFAINTKIDFLSNFFYLFDIKYVYLKINNIIFDKINLNFFLKLKTLYIDIINISAYKNNYNILINCFDYIFITKLILIINEDFNENFLLNFPHLKKIIIFYFNNKDIFLENKIFSKNLKKNFFLKKLEIINLEI